MHAAQWAPGDDGRWSRADARRFESWERSVANRLGLGAAVDYALALGVDAIAERVIALGGVAARSSSPRVPGLTLHDRGVERCGIVTFTVDGVDVYELAARLRAQGINISVSTIDFAALRLRGARARRRRARVGALLQHRGRARAVSSTRSLLHAATGASSTSPLSNRSQTARSRALFVVHARYTVLSDTPASRGDGLHRGRHVSVAFEEPSARPRRIRRRVSAACSRRRSEL